MVQLLFGFSKICHIQNHFEDHLPTMLLMLLAGARPEKTSEYGSDTSDRQVHGTSSEDSIPHLSDAHKDICLSLLNSYHLTRSDLKVTMV